jgi:RimJ/RimL family protein N-acetyltransferase
MEFQFETQGYYIFGLKELIEDNSFYEDIIEVLKDNEVNNLPPYFYNVDTIEDAKDWFEFMIDEVELFFIKGKYSQATIGFIFVHTISGGNSHIGYTLAREYWNKGIATEVLHGFIGYCDESKKWENLVAGVDKQNTPSIALLEKLGFTMKEETAYAYFYHYII